MGEDLTYQPINFGELGEKILRVNILCNNNKGYSLDAWINFDEDSIGRSVKIEYCPMCGRKLHDEEWQQAVEYWKEHQEEDEL